MGEKKQDLRTVTLEDLAKLFGVALPGTDDHRGTDFGDDEGKWSWAEMVDEDHATDEEKAKAQRVVHVTQEVLEKLLRQTVAEKGAEGVTDLLFIMALGAEVLVREFRDEAFTAFPEVKEEDIFRYRRLIQEARQAAGQV